MTERHCLGDEDEGMGISSIGDTKNTDGNQDRDASLISLMLVLADVTR